VTLAEIDNTAGEALALNDTELRNNPAFVYLMSKAPGSRRTLIGALGTMAAILTGTEAKGKDAQLAAAIKYPWHELRHQDTEALRAILVERYSFRTVNKMLSALRSVLKAAWRLELISDEDRARASDLERATGERLLTGRALSSGEIDALMRACAEDTGAAGIRDGAMLALMYSCGLRRAEVAGLDLADYDTETGDLVIRGKRNKERLGHVVNGAADAVADWITARSTEPGPLFCPINKGGALDIGEGITAQAVYYILSKRATEAGIEDISPHDFRRTFIGDLLDAGADIATVQKMAGHSNVTTTAGYDRRPEAIRRKAAELLYVPYRRRS
jgi:site-specific recombinase XerD